MKNVRKIHQVAATMFYAAVLATNAGHCLAAPQDASMKSKSESTPQHALVSSAPIAVSHLPDALAALSNDSERLYSLASADDWPNIPRAANVIRLDYNQLPINLANFPVQSTQLASVIMDLNQQVLGHHRYAIMRSANRVMLIAARLTSAFRSRVPFDIELLGYYGREIEVGAMTGDIGAVHSAASQLPQVLTTLHSTVAQRGSITAAEGLDNIAALLAHTGTPDDYHRLAISIAEEMANLRRIFQ
jgi:hypothetical protein